MKIKTFVQSSFPRTVATSVLTLILLAMATRSAIGQLTFTITDLGPGAAYGINNSGQVVGNSVDAFIYSEGTMTHLGTLLGVAGSAANGINNQGEGVDRKSGV